MLWFCGFCSSSSFYLLVFSTEQIRPEPSLSNRSPFRAMRCKKMSVELMSPSFPVFYKKTPSISRPFQGGSH